MLYPVRTGFQGTKCALELSFFIEQTLIPSTFRDSYKYEIMKANLNNEDINEDYLNTKDTLLV